MVQVPATVNGADGHAPKGHGSDTSTSPPTGQRNTETNGTGTSDGDVFHVETDFLVVGCGPAGASLACFLGSHGLNGIMIGAAPGTANTPRAHITNMAALECLRDIGLDQDLKQVSTDGSSMIHTRWCHSMAGEEYTRTYSWGHNPKRKGDYEAASPCSPVDLPQTLLEPILVRRAAQSGFKVRFNTTLESFSEDPKTKLITASVRDKVSNLEYKIRTKYLLGADGAQSRVMKQLGIPLVQKPGQGIALNVLVKADLSHLVDTRKGNLHWIMQPDCEHPEFGERGLIRMVKPWHEWMFILFPERDWDSSIQPTKEQYLKRVRELIGDDTPAEILNVSKWFINEIVAENYSVGGNIFCLGDAVHRHPPFNGLGSNTCIQDAFNLAWKLAYVHKGLASPCLLDTYNVERQPVGAGIIARANQAFRDHVHVWDALGSLPSDISERRKMFRELSEDSPEGKKRRCALREAIKGVGHEFHGLGIEMGQHYTGSAIHDGDESEPFTPLGRAASDPVYYYEPNTYPGSRLPHVWLNKAIPTTPTSTIDLAGHGRFVLFTGIGGDAWKTAAKRISNDMGVQIDAHSIGYRQDWEDVYFDWEALSGVDESGAVLVRPDRFVVWRAPEVLGSADKCTARLARVMRSVLGLSDA